MAWVSFCISTYMRPQFLRKQIESLLKQTFSDFEIVVSDNDPNASAMEVVSSFNDDRIKYYNNTENLGMIKSFNKSIDRSSSEYIVMVTDDDPIENTFLSSVFNLYQSYPGYSLYGGFKRKHKSYLNVEIVKRENFIMEILDNNKTTNLLWSSCMIEKASALKIGKIPDYGSPHLADHVLLALVGNEKGGIIINKMFSTLTSHDSNFSKTNFDYYYIACVGFYKMMTNQVTMPLNEQGLKNIILTHLEHWFISNIFNLKRYYSVKNIDKNKIELINGVAHKIMSLHFMRKIRFRYFIKQVFFKSKLVLKIVK